MDCTVGFMNPYNVSKCDQVSKPILRYDDKRLYVTVFERDSKQDPKFKYSLNYLTFNFLNLVLNNSYFDDSKIQLYFMVHAANLKHIPAQGSTQLTIPRMYFQKVFFSKRVLKYLPWPFKSNCDPDTRVSQDKCIDDCVRMQMVKLCGKIPKSHTLLIEENTTINRDETFCQRTKPIDNDCHNRCSKPDCIQEIYTIYESGSFPRKNESITQINVGAPLRSAVEVYKYAAKVNIVDLVVYVASSFGFWFGFAILPFIKTFLEPQSSVTTAKLKVISQVNRLRVLRHRYRNRPFGRLYLSLAEVKASIQPLQAGLSILCITGLLCQSYDIILVFFSRQVILDIDMREAKTDFLPAFTVLNELMSVANRSAFCYKENGNCTSAEIDQNLYNAKWNSSFSIKSWSNHILKVNLLYENCAVYDVGERNVQNCTNLGEVRRTLSAYHVYDTFFARTHKDKYNSLFELNPESDVNLIEIRTRIEPKIKTYFAVHSPETIPNFEFDDWVPVVPGIADTIEYSQSILRLLPEPYPSRCIDYDGKSRRNIINECVINGTKELCNATPPFISYEFKEELSNIVRPDDTCFVRANLFKRCLDKYSASACSNDLFHIRSVSSYNRDVSHLVIKVSRPHQSNCFLYIMKPKLELMDLIVYLSGCLSLWYGFSFISLVTFLSRKLKVNSKKKVPRQHWHFPYVLHKELRPDLKLNRRLDFFKLATVLFSSAAAIVQSGLIIREYFEYGTFVDIAIGRETKSVLPGLTVVLYNEEGKSLGGNDNKELISIENCRLPQVCPLEVTPLKLNSSDGNIVYVTLFARTTDNENRHHQYSVYGNRGSILTLKLNATEEARVVILIHAPDEPPNIFQGRFIRTWFENGRRLDVTYSRRTLHLLRKPYLSNCVDYKSRKYFSRYDCLGRCFRKMGTSAVNKLRTKHCPDCKEEDCYSESYNTHLVKTSNFQYNENMYVRLMKPRGQWYEEIKLNPRYTWSYILVYISNTLAVWLGFYMFRVLELRQTRWIAYFTREV